MFHCLEHDHHEIVQHSKVLAPLHLNIINSFKNKGILTHYSNAIKQGQTVNEKKIIVKYGTKKRQTIDNQTIKTTVHEIKK